MDTSKKNYDDFKGSIAIGPLVGLPSSNWVGVDIANHLLNNGIKVEKFGSFNTQIEADCIILVKLMPKIDWLIDKIERGVKVIYAPVDIFHSKYVFWRYRNRLKLFSGFLIHNDKVGELISKVSDSPQFFIEHYLKYELDKCSDFTKVNELLWVGHLEYIPSLLKFVKKIKPELKIRALSDLEKLPYYENYLDKSLREIDCKYSIEKKSDDGVYISGVFIEQWSEQKQAELMQTCIAAFDTKMNSFAHNLKPPTKAQKFIYNKIPFACSEHSFSFKYFEQRGLKVAKLDELSYLVSDDYRQNVSDFCDAQKWRVNIDSVASSYLHACENSTPPPYYGKTYLYLMDAGYFIVYFSLRVMDKIKTVFKLNKNKG
ncbi:hypothetical protein [Paraglaciecola polaris]|uniref:Uncharacterized protein n=1 Tax=Paraglaciecola polaris LMG 21857 TaxID=1129793 RepID=K6Z4B9_9ALTE|nr:hypothetical protein [Paraglaciecola polaris]GAC31076.1 hypothetical protein GPLA_0155 [Paraglaciecola polaris LMG 21857]